VFIAAYYTKLITMYLSYYKKAVWGYELLKYLDTQKRTAYVVCTSFDNTSNDHLNRGPYSNTGKKQLFFVMVTKSSVRDNSWPLAILNA